MKLKQDLEEIDSRKNRVFELFESGFMKKEMVKSRLESIEKEIDETVKKMEYIEKELAEIPSGTLDYDEVKRVFENFNLLLEKADPEDQKVLFHMMIEKITVTDRKDIDTIEIAYNEQMKEILESRKEGISSENGGMPSFSFRMVI